MLVLVVADVLLAFLETVSLLLLAVAGAPDVLLAFLETVSLLLLLGWQVAVEAAELFFDFLELTLLHLVLEMTALLFAVELFSELAQLFLLVAAALALSSHVFAAVLELAPELFEALQIVLAH